MAGIRDKEFGIRDPGVNMQLRNLLKIIFINLVIYAQDQTFN